MSERKIEGGRKIVSEWRGERNIEGRRKRRLERERKGGVERKREEKRDR